MTKRKQIEAELQQIASEHGGMLAPAHIVNYARNKKTALHSQFEWRDSKAGESYRLWQARKIVATYVIISEADHEPIRTYVSLREDRAEGGYRTLVSVLSDEEQRAALFSDAMRDLLYWKRKYARLQELAPIFEAIHKLPPPKRGKRGGEK